jgi:hypothetical protein
MRLRPRDRIQAVIYGYECGLTRPGPKHAARAPIQQADASRGSGGSGPGSASRSCTPSQL